MATRVALALALGIFASMAVPARADVAAAGRCKATKASVTGKKAFELVKAFGKNLRTPDSVRLGEDIAKAQSKFTRGFQKAEDKGGCQTTGDAGAIEAKVDAFVLEIIDDFEPNVCGDGRVNQADEECDGADDSGCPGRCLEDCTCPEPVCGNGSWEVGEQCDPPGGTAGCPAGLVCTGFCTCETIAACECGSPEPSRYSFTSKAPLASVCGSTDGGLHPSLACQGLYVGGGGGGLPLPVMAPDEGTTRHGIVACNGTTLALGPTTAVAAGARECTEGKKCSASSDNAGDGCRRDADCPGGGCEARCLFGAPLPILNRALPDLSICVISEVSEDSLGAVDCLTGASFVHLPLDWRVHLASRDTSPTTSGHQPCPICVGATVGVASSGTCEGGPNAGEPCTPGTTAYERAGCCEGGANGRGPCSDDSDCPGSTCLSDCSVYPTSHDCPPDPATDLGVIHVPFSLTTETNAKMADDAGTFCGYCRDVDIEGSQCFEGDPDPGQQSDCPDSTVIPCEPASAAEMSGCGEAVRCTTDADCQAPYETCEQGHGGAFHDSPARTISYTGTRAGDLRDGVSHPTTLVSTFCVEPLFMPCVDVYLDLGGPGGLSLEGEAQLD